MDTVYEEEYKGFTIKIKQDDNSDSPRDWDNAGKIVCWHRRYNLGDIQPKTSPETWIVDFMAVNCNISDSLYDRYNNDEITTDEAWNIVRKEYIFLPLYVYEHGGITISTKSFNDRWDSGQAGWIYISKKDAVKEWGKKLYTKFVEQKAIRLLNAEVKTYDDFLTGNVYGYQVFSGDEVIDSCWGYYPDYNDKTGYDYCLSEAHSFVDSEVKEIDNRIALAIGQN